jgi:hypothetical protein
VLSNEFFVSHYSGDDAATGSTANDPLQSIAEVRRRLGGTIASSVVNVTVLTATGRFAK